MSFDDAIKALSLDALKNVKDGHVIGLGSGRAATALVKSLSKYIKTKKITVKCVPTSMQIKLIAEKGGLELIDADQIDDIMAGAKPRAPKDWDEPKTPKNKTSKKTSIKGPAEEL